MCLFYVNRTYTEVVLTPGRNLNLIIGPNGTGKSTLVSAIALGLCGTPKTLGKHGSIGMYVKTGCEKAKIEITLRQTPTKTITVGRVILSTHKSQWSLDGRVVDEKSVKEVIKNMNIQVMKFIY